jgi:hypothetical protein
MEKIKVFHEAPLSIMSQIQSLTDGDYCLPHLMDENEEYKKFFIDAKAKGRYIIMDNSLHELGHAYNEQRLIHWVNEIKPQEFIVPDVWMDINMSRRNAKYWSKIELPKETTKVAVVQAKDTSEATLCYNAYKDLGYKKIAFSYGAEFYTKVTPHPNVNIAKALGRVSLISNMFKNNIISPTDRVHLLGTCFPGEFGFYKDFTFIESIDTSNPVMAAVENKRYNCFGLTEKPKANMNTVFNKDSKTIDLDLVYYNIQMFKKINTI